MRHVHVDDGGQAIVAEQFHRHSGRKQNDVSAEQSQATGSTGDGPRCLARTRAGTPSQSRAARGRRRCRMHGGTNPGAPKGNRNAGKHGAQSQAVRTDLPLWVEC
ncbi:HGGxSTG domain-containing protein [Thalassobaculum litoreum]|uniref:HGGxSTG domain-containing protein n=1 Tax=Thalassobaculum litoreum TaxID=420996 RepID=UPI002481E098|nr:HGGxSTG domain-containing protein [Thalassobaculum litoreum]